MLLQQIISFLEQTIYYDSPEHFHLLSKIWSWPWTWKGQLTRCQMV